MDYLSEVYMLSTKFLSDYPASAYPELMYKAGRPYTCLLIEYHEDYYICIPFRSSINHNNAFIFTTTRRSQRTRSGLDYSKMAIIKNPDYINSSTSAIVDPDEYSEMMRNLPRIAREAVSYLETYISHINGSMTLHPRTYNRKYRYSTLPYFDDILLNQTHVLATVNESNES